MAETMMRQRAAWILVAAIVVGWSAAGAARAQATAPAPPAADKAAADEQLRLDRLWARTWPQYAKRFFLSGEEFYLNKYDPKHGSSRGLTPGDAADKLARKVEVKVGINVTQTKVIQAPPPEAEALAMALPDLRIGEYGYVHSFVVEEVLGPNEMVVSQMWLIDRDQLYKDREATRRNIGWGAGKDEEMQWMFRERNALAERQSNDMYWRRTKVEGIPTKTLVPGTRYKGTGGKGGVHVAVVGKTDVERRRDGYSNWSYQVPVLAPVEALKKGLSEEQFKTMLQKKGMTPEQFMALVAAEQRKSPREAEKRVLEALEAAEAKAESSESETAGAE